MTLDKMQIVTFMVEGRGEQIPVAGELQGSSDDAKCAALNQDAEKMTVALERELRNLMPLGSGVSIQAEMSFHPGSIVLAASISLLSWAGNVALEPIRDELGNLIRTTIRRVLSREMPQHGVGGMDISVRPMTRSSSQSPSAEAAAPVVPASRVSEWWWLVVFGLLGAVVLLLLADRLISSSVSRVVYVPQSTAGITATPPAPSNPTR